LADRAEVISGPKNTVPAPVWTIVAQLRLVKTIGFAAWVGNLRGYPQMVSADIFRIKFCDSRDFIKLFQPIG